MAPGVPARMAIVCAVLTIAGPARAERRQVAVVDLSEDDRDAHVLAQQIYKALNDHPDLGPPNTRELDAALAGNLADEDAPRIQRAKDDKAAAEEALAQFKLDEAKQQAKRGIAELQFVVPTADAIGLYADLSLLLGQAYLATRDANSANHAFQLSHRLDPMKRLDPGVYLPAVVSAFDSAAPPSRKAQLAIEGNGQLWIDGIERGTAPTTIELGAGDHLVQLAGETRETTGVVVVVPDTPALTIADAPLPQLAKVRRARLALARAVDPAARAGAMQRLAALLGVSDAVLIMKGPDGRIQVQTWRDRAPGFTALRAHGSEPPDELLAPLAPPKPVEPARPPVPVLPPLKIHDEPEPAWYQKRWVQASVVGGVVFAVVGGILLARHAGHVMFFPGVESSM